MREIKFRAWDSERGKMIAPYDLWEGTLMASGLGRTYTVDTMPIPMQYTGRKDKNGKEIYEGDVLRGIYDSYKGEEEVEEIVEWSSLDDDEYGYAYQGFSFPCRMVQKEMEVIGNIYENPELIK